MIPKRLGATLVVALLALWAPLAPSPLLYAAAPDRALADRPVGRDVDVEAVRRMGNTQEHVGTINAFDEATEAFYAEMAAIPPDDNGKWFVTVVTQPGCQPCKALLAKWPKDPYLLSLADPDDPAKSWAHFNVYDLADKAQAWRFKGIKIAATPTIIVQPPLKGRGDPATVVIQIVYNASSEKVVADIAAAIRLYLKKLNDGPNVQPVRSSDGAPLGARSDATPPARGFGQLAPPENDWTLRRPLFRPNGPSPSATPWAPSPNDAPPATPSVQPSPYNAPDAVDGLQFPPPNVLTPNAPPVVATPTPSGTKPAAPVAVNPSDDANNTPPEAIVITDADAPADDETQGRLREVVDRLKERVGGKLKTRPMDWLDAQGRFPVRRDELPAVVMTSNGRVVDKLSARLLPLLFETATGIPLAGLSWQSIALAVGGVVAVWGLNAWRKSRQAAGKPQLSQEAFDKLLELLKTVSPSAAPPSTPPTTPPHNPNP